jgi:hypothetical protein
VEVVVHPALQAWLLRVEQLDFDVYAELSALLVALGRFGEELGDPESHPVVTSRVGLHASRRTPPSTAAPLAVLPPVLRVLYCFCLNAEGETVAVALLGGDKTQLGNHWYPPNVAEAERRLAEYCLRKNLIPKRSRK